MKISDIRIERLSANGFSRDVEGLLHKKILACLSVVQAVSGSYDIKIGNSRVYSTGEKGVFIAPSNVVQEIIHHNGDNGVMQAQWIFLDVVVNGEYRFDEIYDFPVILDKSYAEEVDTIIGTVRYSDNYFDKMKAVYSLLKILSKVGKERHIKNSVRGKLEKYVYDNCKEQIKASDIAKALYCSTVQVFRYTKKFYGLSPANYVNFIRLQQAETQLLNTDKSITEIAFLVGINDSAYFSALFKKAYGDSPLKYRKKNCKV